MKKLIWSLVTMHIVFFAYSQQRITGIVVDADSKEPLIGATIVAAGNYGATITDQVGRFTINATEGTQLTISYVGYAQQTVAANKNLYVALNADYQLERIIIKGVRANADDPVSQTTVDKKQIEKEYVGEHAIFMLDKLSPSIFSYSESGTAVGNYGQIRLRGIGQERINFTLNGAPLNDMIDHGVFFSNFSDITSSFESIQVQRGVGTSSTGASSFAGSINMESFNVAGNEAFSKLELGAGSFNSLRANYSVNTGVMENGFGFYSSFSRLWSDGYRDFTSTDATSFFLTGGYFGEKDMFRVTAFSGRSQNGLGYYTIDQSILDNDPTFNNLTANDQDDFSQYMVQIQHTHQYSEKLSQSTTAYYGGAGGDFAEGTPDEDTIFVENYFAEYYPTFFSINYPLQNDHYGLMSNLYFEDDRFELSGGVHGYLFYRENRESIQPDNANPYYDDETRKQELAIFAKANYKLNDHFSAFADIQMRAMQIEFLPDYAFIFGDDLSNIDLAPFDLKRNFQFLNPSLGLKYQIEDGVSTYLSFGRSNREPTRVDLIGGFQLNANSLGVLQTATFEPESVNDLELGINVNRQRLAFSANAFYMDFVNEIAPLGEVIAFGVQRRINIEKSYRAGLEFSWNYLLTDQLSTRGNLSYLRSEISALTINDVDYSGTEQVLSPNWIGNVGLIWQLGQRLSATVDANFMSESYMEYTNDPELVVPSFVVFDAAIAYEIADRLRVNLQVRNLLDKKYYTFGAPSDVDFSGQIEPGFFVQPPRNIFLTTSFTF